MDILNDIDLEFYIISALLVGIYTVYTYMCYETRKVYLRLIGLSILTLMFLLLNPYTISNIDLKILNFCKDVIISIIYYDDLYLSSDKGVYNDIILGFSFAICELIYGYAILIYIGPTICPILFNHDKNAELEAVKVIKEIGSIMITLVAPIIEELIFRLCLHEIIRFVLYYCLPETYSSYMFVVYIPKLLFVAAHLHNATRFATKKVLIQVILVLITSKADQVYEYGGLLPCIISHITHNFIAFYLL